MIRPPRPLTRAEVREVDRRAIQDLGMSGQVLMENAGLGLTDAVQRELRALGAPGGAVIIVCGKGNNGGDGFVLARHLALRGGDPRLVFAGRLATAPRTGDAGVNLALVEHMRLPLDEALDGDALRQHLRRLDQGVLLVDALYGTGLEGALRDPGLGHVRALVDDGRPVLAVDIPSGLDCDTGRPLGAAVRARRTVTFVGEKAGFAAPGAREYTGEVEVVSIGCPPVCWDHVR